MKTDRESEYFGVLDDVLHDLCAEALILSCWLKVEFLELDVRFVPLTRDGADTYVISVHAREQAALYQSLDRWTS